MVGLTVQTSQKLGANDCVDEENARHLVNDAINTLKELEGMAVRWRSSGSSGVNSFNAGISRKRWRTN